MTTPIIIKFSLDIKGLKISYFLNQQVYCLAYDPSSTCDLLESLEMIEGFETDSNGEPVILYTDKNEREGYGYEFWYQFIKSMPLSKRVAEIIIEASQDLIMFKKISKTIDWLLQPRKAA
jgi:hypothetical protein